MLHDAPPPSTPPSAPGLVNAEAIALADRVVLAVPGAALPGSLDGAAPFLDGKLVIDVVVPLRFERGVATLATLPGAPSAGELIRRRPLR